MKLSDIVSFVESPEEFTFTLDGREIPRFYNDDGTVNGKTRFYAAGFEFGATHVIACDSFETAWTTWVDELPAIPEEELIEAYGPDSGEYRGKSFYDMAIEMYQKEQECLPRGNQSWDEVRAIARRMLESYMVEGKRYPELVEGYEHQSNATGTGVVATGYYAWMREVSDELEVTRKNEGE